MLELGRRKRAVSKLELMAFEERPDDTDIYAWPLRSAAGAAAVMADSAKYVPEFARRLLAADLRRLYREHDLYERSFDAMLDPLGD